MSANRRPPDVVGYTLDDARETLAASGWPAADVVETRPPRRVLAGPMRVVRQRIAAWDRVALVVCGERAEDARV